MTKIWKNLPDQSTPIHAEALNYMQKGVEDFNAINSVVSGIITPISPWVDTANTQILRKRNGVVQLIIQLNGGDPWSPNVIFVVPDGFKPMFNTVAIAATMDSSGSVSILYDSTTNDFLVYGLGEKPADWTTNSKLIISMTYLCEV